MIRRCARAGSPWSFRAGRTAVQVPMASPPCAASPARCGCRPRRPCCAMRRPRWGSIPKRFWRTWGWTRPPWPVCAARGWCSRPAAARIAARADRRPGWKSTRIRGDASYCRHPSPGRRSAGRAPVHHGPARPRGTGAAPAAKAPCAHLPSSSSPWPPRCWAPWQRAAPCRAIRTTATVPVRPTAPPIPSARPIPTADRSRCMNSPPTWSPGPAIPWSFPRRGMWCVPPPGTTPWRERRDRDERERAWRERRDREAWGGRPPPGTRAGTGKAAGTRPGQGPGPSLSGTLQDEARRQADQQRWRDDMRSRGRLPPQEAPNRVFPRP